MEMPTEDTPAEAYLPRSGYTLARVAADPKAAGLEKGLAAVHADLKAKLRERDDAEEEAQNKSAVLDARDSDCDDDIEGFELHLLGAVKKERNHPKYQRYFKGGLREVTTAEPRKAEPAIVGEILKAMAEDKDDPEIGEAVGAWTAKLTASRALVTSADEELGAIEATLTHLDEKVIPALMAKWREEYKKLEGALLGVYASTPKRVDRFFKPFRKRRKEAKKTG